MGQKTWRINQSTLPIKSLQKAVHHKLKQQSKEDYNGSEVLATVAPSPSSITHGHQTDFELHEK